MATTRAGRTYELRSLLSSQQREFPFCDDN